MASIWCRFRSDVGRLAFLLVLGTVGASPAHAQIQWFTPDGMSWATGRAYASVGSGVDDRCTFASAHEPPSCAWCRQFDRCRRLPLGPGASASSDDRARADVERPPVFDATTRAGFRHGLEFRPDGFRLALATDGRYENRGTGGPGNRVIGSASGEAFLRVPSGADVEYDFEGRMEWTPTATASIQLVGVPNSGADLSAGFVFQSLHLPGGSPSAFRRSGRLAAGTYRLIWWAGLDSIGRPSAEVATLTAHLKTRRLASGWPQCPAPRPPPPLSRRPWYAAEMTPAPRPMTPSPVPLRPDRSHIADPDAPLIDVDLGIDLYVLGHAIWKSAFHGMRRQALVDARLPIASCVVAAHGNPDAIAYRDELYVAPAELAKVIASRCGLGEPVVLLACNSGRPKVDGGSHYAQQLADELQRAGRPNAEVWAPNAYVSATGPGDSEFEARSDGLRRPPTGAAPEVAPRFVRYTGR